MDIAATIIARARQAYLNTPQEDGGGTSADAFDYLVSIEGIESFGRFYNEAYSIANEGQSKLPATADDAEIDARATARRERAQALWQQVLPELESYAERCRAAKYTGWSRESGGTVRRVR